MNRETKLNLAFILFIVAVSVPGAVLLFQKKLDPTEELLYLPDPVRHQVPYMLPFEPAARVARVMPPQTGAWLGKIAGMPPAQSLPAMSQERRFEWSRLGEGLAPVRIQIIVWDPQLQALEPEATIQTDTQAIVPMLEQSRTEAIPPEIQRELQDYGFVRPPERITLLHYRLDQALASPSSIRLSWKTADRELHDEWIR